MSKDPRQTAKQNRPINKQNADQTAKEEQSLKAENQSSKQVQPGNKQEIDQPSRQDQTAGRQLTRQAAKYERRREEQRRREEERQSAIQRKRIMIVGAIVAAMLVLSVVGYFVYRGYVHPTTGSTRSATATPTLIDPNYPPVDGVPCDALEQTVNHYHAHVSYYINGRQVAPPANIGIAGNPYNPSCYYWLHTHAADGIIHIEAPAKRTFTLGNFFDIWGQKFSTLQYPAELDQPGGPGWQIYVNGKLVSGDFHNIVLQSHMLITLAYNSPNVKPITSYAWNGL
jgi:hypothetical protein